METVVKEPETVQDVQVSEDELPVAQRLSKNGFKIVTMEQLEKQFALKKVNAKLYKDAMTKLKKKLGKSIDKVNSYRTEEYAYGKRIEAIGPTYIAGHQYVGDDVYAAEPLPEAVLITEYLDSYVTEEIPERCIASVSAAKKLGATEFVVVYPGIKKGAKGQPLIDPVILTIMPKFNKNSPDVMFEIDMWE